MSSVCCNLLYRWHCSILANGCPHVKIHCSFNLISLSQAYFTLGWKKVLHKRPHGQDFTAGSQRSKVTELNFRVTSWQYKCLSSSCEHQTWTCHCAVMQLDVMGIFFVLLKQCDLVTRQQQCNLNCHVTFSLCSVNVGEQNYQITFNSKRKIFVHMAAILSALEIETFLKCSTVVAVLWCTNQFG